MHLLMTVLLLLLCLLISNVISHYTPFIPTALTQIALGVIIALVFKNISFPIETEWFLLLFVAPLLYNDGRHFPREELWKMRFPIFGNALVLVLLTTLGGGYFIHWMVPDIPLAAAFALAAILSPTDPVAVNGIAKRIHIPERVLNLVRGESLINDASGLVAFNYAVAAVVTGYFSLQKAIFDFSYMFLLGAVLGLILGLVVTLVRFALRKEGINDVVFHSLLQVLTPFIIFIITEELLHASGVIAVVVAGIVHSLIREQTETIIAEEQVLTENIWSIVLFVLNGIVFLLLGLNIPSSMSETVANPNMDNWLVIGYVIAIGFVILGIRFIWSYAFLYYEYALKKTKDAEKPNLKTALVISLTGVRGTVTMAGVLSIPLFLASGEPFPEHSLILFLAAGVILFTLIVATIFLPILSKGETTEGEVLSQIDLGEAKRKLLLVAIKKIKLEIKEENESVAYELIDEYKIAFQKLQSEQSITEEGAQLYQQRMREIRLMALRAERKYIHEVMDKKGMDETVFETFEKSLDYREEALSNNVRSEIMYLIRKMIRTWKRFNSRCYKDEETRLAKLRLGKDIQLKAFEAALKYLEEYRREQEKSDIVYAVILDYRRMINRLKRRNTAYNEKSEEQKEELRIKIMDMERSEIHRMYEAGEINRENAKELRRYVNYIESVILHKPVE
ncbi:Na+/H+ antiporter [Clostridium sp. A1-XYC3]|uniref:Na+/H+ antiporter n=1 Tax=Clostridium tanneri TaxID=3037988 RepID=A0ABU4JRJ0_9CLOT|nr:Na+/H+ antiporter [Clostridium sp. A1-XYC3]MDW8800777.1 Na+/H+ antiporter [Clostridium sp. A1-XYC3]